MRQILFVNICLSKDAAGLDFVGDIHGQFDKLTGLLAALGYERCSSSGFRHPLGRRAVFLGDYIDRGPKIRETLQAIKAMVDSGDAFALMGNHEFNAIAFATPNPRGGYLRPHSEKNICQHGATLEQFNHAKNEWLEWLAWFKALPMWLDFGGARAVHACWDRLSIETLAEGSLHDDRFLKVCATEGTREFASLESLLKGPELSLPKGHSFSDKQGIVRTKIRSRWWNLTSSESLTFGDLAMPPGALTCDVGTSCDQLESIPDYSEAIPVFVGHYWLPRTARLEPLASNVCCLDFSAGLDGPLVAYRWDGEERLDDCRILSAS